MKLLSISTDRKIFEEGSAVRARQIEYSKNLEEMHIIVFSKRDLAEQSLSPGCFVYPTRSRSKIFYPFDAIRLGRFIIKRRNITNIVCQDSSFTAMAGVALKKESGLPLELQVHTDIGSPYFAKSLQNRIRKALSISYLKKADCIRVVSDRIKRYLVESLGIDAERVYIKPISVDTDLIAKTPITVNIKNKYPQFEKIVLMASRLTPEKNVSMAIQGWAEVVRKNSKAGLVIVGEGSCKPKLEALTRKLGLEKSIIFESWSHQSTIYSYMKSCDVFLSTSYYEGYGMSLVEARAAGCKVVSTDVGVAREIGATIISFDYRDIAASLDI